MSGCPLKNMIEIRERERERDYWHIKNKFYIVTFGRHEFDNMNPPRKRKCCHHAWAPRNEDYWFTLFLVTLSNTYVSGLDLQFWGIILPTGPHPNKGHVFEVLLEYPQNEIDAQVKRLIKIRT